jgi:ESCRT-II complex subunit VPS36
VSGIIRRREQALGAADAVAEAAMGDLDALMKAAGEMVQLVERYSAILAEKSSRSSSSTSASGTSASGSTSGRGGNGGSDGAWSYDLSETSSEAGERNEVENILQIIGVISPVTKFSAGRLYHEQLAQQIADMLLTNDCINRLGGMVAATDVYCVYNRARGTELVSPDDFHQAIKLFNARPGLHLQVVQLDSGVSVIKDTKLSQSDIFNRVADLARQQPVRGISINDVSVAFHVSYLIARDQVLAAEAAGRLCRDDCLSGVQFFENVYWL